VESVFAIVLFVVVGVAVVAAIASLVLSGRPYDQIGRGGLSVGEDRAGRPTVSASLTVGQPTAQEAEAREMLEARNRRRAARGQPLGDVDAELAELLRPAARVDPELEAEVRQLVESRNARLVARGDQPLDVEAEVRRRLRDAGAGG
jgi:hypothetical protein